MVAAAQCPSEGLADGSFDGWVRSVGTRGLGTTIHAVTTPTNYPSSTGSNMRFMYNSDTSETDPYTGDELSLIPPNGSYSIRIGDRNDGSLGERMTKTFTITNETALFTFYFAAVSERPDHQEEFQPIFGARLKDQNDSTIFCTDIRYVPNFTNYPTSSYTYDNGSQNPNQIRWVDWQVITLDLRPYLGQTVTVEIANGDCLLSQHFSYGYFAIDCNPAKFDYHWCLKDEPLVLTAPPGWETYDWDNGDTSQVAQYFGLADGDSVVCELVSNYGCESELAVELSGSDVTSKFTFLFDTSLIAAVFANGSSTYKSNIDSVLWNFGDGNTSTEFNPTHSYDTFGVFNITLYVWNDSGCVDSSTRQFTYYPPSYPEFELQDTCGLTADFIDLSKQPVAGEITGYRWLFGDGGTSTQKEPSHTYQKGGSYTVTLITISNGVRQDTFADVIRVYPFPIPDFYDEPACIDNPTRFTDSSTISMGSIERYEWTFGTVAKGDSTVELISFPEPGTVDVTLRVTSDANCVADLKRTVEVYPKTVKASFEYAPERIEVLEPYVNYTDLSVNPEVWRWYEDGQLFSRKQNLSMTYPFDTARYEIRFEVENEYGCQDDTTQLVVIEPIVALYIPNAYSPNSDGVNDGYMVKGEGIQDFLMVVRNRWGQEVCRFTELNQPIDLVEFLEEPQGVFSYEAYIVDKYGRESSRTGNIVVVK